MEINKSYVIELLEINKMSQNQLAIKAGVSKATISRWLNGSRGEGRRLIGGILRAFPEVDTKKLLMIDQPMKKKEVQ
ncbi:MAG: helix-turn-helix domain-containing protein [Clostridium sp.]